MVCDEAGCGQKATVHLTEIINGEVTKLNLCEECAKKKGTQMEEDFGIADLLQGLADQNEPSFMPAAKKTKCASCGMSFDEFKKIGRLGCSECYSAFREHLAPLLRRIHSSSQHIGKTPVTAGVETKPAKPVPSAARKQDLTKISSELLQLKKSLQKAVDTESYEEAAKLRDQIKTLETRKKESSAA